MWVISKTIAWVVSPLGFTLLLAAIALLLHVFGRQRVAKRAAYVAAIWLWLWSTPAISGWFASKLEANYSPHNKLATVSAAPAAVILGGAIGTPSLERPFPSLTDSSDRIWHAARLYRGNLAPLLLLSGGSDMSIALESEAQSMKTLLMELGIPGDRLILETQSRTTQENARFSAQLLKERGITTVHLITSALHMQRAVLEFQAEGLNVLPAPVNVTIPPPWEAGASWVPEAAALRHSAAAMKELVGRLATRVRSL